MPAQSSFADELDQITRYFVCKAKDSETLLKYAVLKSAPSFKYFDYPDFLTPYSGIIHIRKYAEIHQATDLVECFEEISRNVKRVKAELYRVLVEEGGYLK